MKTMENRNQIWKRYERLVRAIVNSFIRRGLFDHDEREDLFHEGFLAFVKIFDRYDPTRNFGTLLTFVVKNELLTIYTTRTKRSYAAPMYSYEHFLTFEFCDENRNLPRELLDMGHVPDKMVEMIDFSRHLDDEGRAVLLFLFTHHEDVLLNAKSLAPRNLKSSLIKLLKKHRFKEPQILAGMRSIREKVCQC